MVEITINYLDCILKVECNVEDRALKSFYIIEAIGDLNALICSYDHTLGITTKIEKELGL